jgi:hypothetical protein
MGQPPELRTWINLQEVIGGPRTTKEGFRDAIRQFPTSGWLITVARLSILFKYGIDANTVASPETTINFAPEMFHAALRNRVSQLASTGRPMFFQGQLRYLAAEAMRLDPQPAENGRTIPDTILGPILLAAGELLYRQHVTVTENLDIMANIIADFLPTYEIDSMNDGFILFLRCYIYLNVIIPRLPAHLKTFDVWECFEKALGFPLKLYSQFLYTFSMHALTERNDLQDKAVPADGGLHISWFSKTAMTPEQISAMFATVCCSLDDFPEKKTKALHGFADFEYLKDHPFFRIKDRLYLMDYELGCAKLESGALWRTAFSMPKKKRLAYFGFWGEVFEEYVHWLFEVYANKEKNVYYPRPAYLKDKDNKPICDAIVICGATAVLIEAKLGTCAADVRYSGDYAKFRGYLEDKLVTGTDRPIGIAQLLTATRNIRSLPPDELPEYLANVKEIMPLLITKDDIGSSWMTNAYLNVRFQQQRTEEEKNKGDVSPLVSMSVGTLERAIAPLQEMALSDILSDRIKEEPFLGTPFEVGSSYVHRGMPRMMFKHIEIMHEMTTELTTDFKMSEE